VNLFIIGCYNLNCGPVYWIDCECMMMNMNDDALVVRFGVVVVRLELSETA